MALGTYTAPASNGKVSSYKPMEKHGRPIIAVPRKFEEEFSSRQFKDPKPAVFYDVVDLMEGAEGTIYPNVVTGSGAMVTRLKNHLVGEPGNETGEPMALAVKIVKVTRDGENDYYSIEQLEGRELQFAAAWDKAFGMKAIDAAREKFVAATDEKPADSTPAWARDEVDSKPLTGLGNGAAEKPAEEAPASNGNGALAAGFTEEELEARIAGLAK